MDLGNYITGKAFDNLLDNYINNVRGNRDDILKDMRIGSVDIFKDQWCTEIFTNFLKNGIVVVPIDELPAILRRKVDTKVSEERAQQANNGRQQDVHRNDWFDKPSW